MKKFLSALSCFGLLVTPALAAERDFCSLPLTPEIENKPAYTITVNQKDLDTTGLPYTAYLEGGTLMVPMALIGQALGYTVDWDARTGDISLEDSVQRAVFRNGSQEIPFTGKLKIIDLGRTVTPDVPPAVLDGHTYVPLNFFEEFFNETGVKDEQITISPVMYELQ